MEVISNLPTVPEAFTFLIEDRDWNIPNASMVRDEDEQVKQEIIVASVQDSVTRSLQSIEEARKSFSSLAAVPKPTVEGHDAHITLITNILLNIFAGYGYTLYALEGPSPDSLFYIEW